MQYYKDADYNTNTFLINGDVIKPNDKNLPVFEKMCTFLNEIIKKDKNFPTTKSFLDVHDYNDHFITYRSKSDDNASNQLILRYSRDIDNIKDVAKEFLEGINTTMKKYFEG